MPRARHDGPSAFRRLTWLVLGMLVAVGSVNLVVPEPVLAAAEPKVAIILGPAGKQTSANRDRARKAAAEAAKYTSNVVKVFTPNATWARASAAMDGASVVVYIGAGSGYPSVSTSRRKPNVQNGFALNPVAGADNRTKRFYGESFIRTTSLASNAVVLLHHANYASGKPPAGYAQPSRKVARRRVDFYGSAFLAAGAAVVISEYSASPVYFIRSIFTRNATLKQVWKGAPAFNGHVTSFKSRRTPGASGLMDPTRSRSGYTRSIIGRLGTRTTAVRMEPASCGSSLQAKVDAASSGSTLNLTGCTYPAGATINKSLTLVGARINPPANTRGLIVTASNVTVDSVVITGSQATTYRWNEVGILTTGSISNLVVRSSTLQRFGNTGIWLGPTTNARITGNTIEDAVYAGIMDIAGSRDRIDNNVVRRIGVVGASANGNNAYGIAISNDGGTLSADIVVDGNTVATVPTWHGLDTHAGQRITFSNNTVSGSPRALFITTDGDGRAATSIMVTGNTFRGPDGAADPVAVTLYATVDVTVTRNVARGWGAGNFVNDYQGRSTRLDVSDNDVTP